MNKWACESCCTDPDRGPFDAHRCPVANAEIERLTRENEVRLERNRKQADEIERLSTLLTGALGHVDRLHAKIAEHVDEKKRLTTQVSVAKGCIEAQRGEIERLTKERDHDLAEWMRTWNKTSAENKRLTSMLAASDQAVQAVTNQRNRLRAELDEYKTPCHCGLPAWVRHHTHATGSRPID